MSSQVAPDTPDMGPRVPSSDAQEIDPPECVAPAMASPQPPSFHPIKQCALFIIVLVLISVAPVQLGQKRIGLTRDVVTGVVDLSHTYTPGRYCFGVWKQFVEFPATLNTIDFSDEAPESGVEFLGVLRARDKNGKRLYLDVSLQYRLLPSELGQLYSKFQLHYEGIYISVLRNAFNEVCSRFDIARVWQNHSEFGDLMRAACREALAPRHAECWDLQLGQVRLEELQENSLVRTQIRKQAQKTEEARKMHAAVRAKTNVSLAAYRKNITVIEASGIAEKHRLEGAAAAAAEANTIQLEADVVKFVRDVVKVNKTNLTMSLEQLVTYQRLMMLQSQTEAHFIYSGSPVEPVNAQAARALSSRRPLFRRCEGAPCSI